MRRSTALAGTPLLGGLLVFLAVLLPMGPAWGCLWDSDTLQEEIEQQGDLFRTITGETIHHGRAWYEARLRDVAQELAGNPESLEARYDAAVAHIQLGNFREAAAHLDAADKIAPGRYKTLANRSVLLERQGRLAEALVSWDKALALRPDAHFGAGWLHRRVLQWKQAQTEGDPQTDLVGTAYDKPYGTTLGRAYRKHLEREGLQADEDNDPRAHMASILRQDPGFAEGWYALARDFHNGHDLHLALWAYQRALREGHPRKAAVQAHMARIFDHWKETLKHGQGRGRTLLPMKASLERLDRQLATAARFAPAYAAAETDLLDSLARYPTAKEVRARLADEGIRPITPEAIGMHGAANNAGHPTDGHPAQRGVLEAKSKARSSGSPANDAPLESEAPVIKGESDAQEAPRRQVSPPIGGDSAAAGAGARALGGAPAPGVAAPVPNAAEGGPSEQGPERSLPAFVLFGFAMLAVCLIVVIAGKVRGSA